MTIGAEDDVPSPCVRLCTLDPATDACVGCLRTRGEIKAWRGLEPAAKRALLVELEGRRSRRSGALPGVTRRA
ncbi:MAG TPA: DUF1289 domain-containing protein [Azospirillum sp.]|nr:DUF1289 domain-containing protein [Azospirillum sp.]